MDVKGEFILGNYRNFTLTTYFVAHAAARITREQLVAILFKYASTYGECRGDESILASYRDLSSVSDYARIPFAWAVENGMISGTSADTLSPQSTATRAQIATVMRRFIQYMASQP